MEHLLFIVCTVNLTSDQAQNDIPMQEIAQYQLIEIISNHNILTPMLFNLWFLAELFSSGLSM